LRRRKKKKKMREEKKKKKKERGNPLSFPFKTGPQAPSAASGPVGSLILL